MFVFLLNHYLILLKAQHLDDIKSEVAFCNTTYKISFLFDAVLVVAIIAQKL